MAGNPENASLWAEADVFISLDLDATIPADVDADFGVDWDLVGLLDGDAGFAYARTEDVTDHYAWGGLIVRTGRKNFKQTVQFTALEDNETTRELLWPGSSDTELIVPRPARVLLALETREDEKVKRAITRQYAEIWTDSWTENESELTKYPFTATIFPSGDGVLFDRQATEDASS